MRRSMWTGLAAVSVLAVASCGGQNVTAPTTAAPASQTELFGGTLTVNGATTHPFAAQAGGSITARLTAVDPAITVGVGLGTWNGTACQIVIANDSAVVNTSLVGTASGIGTFCVRVFDVGNVAGPTVYEVVVVHP